MTWNEARKFFQKLGSLDSKNDRVQLTMNVNNQKYALNFPLTNLQVKPIQPDPKRQALGKVLGIGQLDESKAGEDGTASRS